MTLQFFEPGAKVIIQNDEVYQNGKFLPNANVYFPIEGIFNMFSLQFCQRYSLTNFMKNEKE